MAMTWNHIESSTKKGDAKNYHRGERTVKYAVLMPSGHDENGKLRDGVEFHKNCVEEYGEQFCGRVLFKQLMVLAQSEPRPMMEKGARDESIQAKMRDWKADDVKTRNVKSVQINAYQDALDRFNSATTFEEMVAARDALQAVVANMRAEAASSVVINGTETEVESTVDALDPSVQEEEENGSTNTEEDSGQDTETPPSSQFQRRAGRR